jgi:hypothetical protein
VLIRGKYHGSSFFELLESDHPQLRPDLRSELRASDGGAALASVPHGTTVLAFRFADGVVVAGDRLATEGHRVASRELQKVFPTDSHSLIAIAGAAGPAIEMARMLRIELEHYEKIEGEPLELEGKANKLSQMVRANLPAATTRVAASGGCGNTMSPAAATRRRSSTPPAPGASMPASRSRRRSGPASRGTTRCGSRCRPWPTRPTRTARPAGWTWRGASSRWCACARRVA